MFGFFKVAWFVFWFPTLAVISSLIVAVTCVSSLARWVHDKYGYGAPFCTDLLVLTLKLNAKFEKWVDEFNTTEGENNMPLYGLKTGETHEYIVEDQKKDEKKDQVVFLVSYLSSKQSSDIQNNLFKIEGFGKNRQERLETGTQVLQTLIKGLKGWRNFKFEDGSEVEWLEPKGSIADQTETLLTNIDKIPPKYRDELAAHIRGESTVGND